jgi:7,8-dihydro-6-hydroxymethylpterin-pyrophosphokinase
MLLIGIRDLRQRARILYVDLIFKEKIIKTPKMEMPSTGFTERHTVGVVNRDKL